MVTNPHEELFHRFQNLVKPTLISEFAKKPLESFYSSTQFQAKFNRVVY
jgi:hypothetical protein